MDAGFGAVPYSSAITDSYISFMFSCALNYCDTNRSKLGYDVDIIVHSNHSATWINSLFLFLRQQGMKPVLIA